MLEQSPDAQQSLRAQERRSSCRVSSQETRDGPSAGTIGWAETKMTLEEIQEVGSSKCGDYLEVGDEGEGGLGDDSPGSGLGDEVDGPLL